MSHQGDDRDIPAIADGWPGFQLFKALSQSGSSTACYPACYIFVRERALLLGCQAIFIHVLSGCDTNSDLNLSSGACSMLQSRCCHLVYYFKQWSGPYKSLKYYQKTLHTKPLLMNSYLEQKKRFLLLFAHLYRRQIKWLIEILKRKCWKLLEYAENIPAYNSTLVEFILLRPE